MADHQVFISYAWGGESELVASEIEAELTKKSIQLIRDKSDLGFKGLIREFMEKIGQGNFVVLIISDKYLKSKNCMFELLEVEKKGNFYNRVFPVILPDADIYDSMGIINYLKYWDQKIKDLNARVKELDNLADTRKVQEDINLYTDIRAAIDSLASQLSNMNTLNLEMLRASNFKPLLDGLQLKSGPTPTPTLAPNPSAKKMGKVLYHIPDMMQVEKWTRCTVRLAWEEILLSEGLKIPEKERVIESIRLGNVMQVSLEECRGDHNFEIKCLNNAEQFIFEDDFTEWLYDVKAKSEGSFTLVLRVTLIQIIDGFERKKDIVLERNVKTEAVVPEALVRFDTAEEKLPTPEKGRDSAMAESLDDRNISENSEDCNEPLLPPRVSNRPSSPHPSSPAPSPSFSQNSPSSNPPEIKSTTFRRIFPYAASVVVLAFVGVFFFSNMNSDSLSPDDDFITSSPNPSIDYLENDEEKFLVAMSLEGTSPSGEQINEVMLFLIQPEQMDSLILLNPGNYSMQVFPTTGTANLDLEKIGDFTILEIQDSVSKAAVKPAQIGDRMIDKRQLQINPGTQIMSTLPQPIDSVTSEKFRVRSKKSIEY